jgi:hypothetical protein
LPFAFDIDPAVGSRNQPEVFADLTAGLFPLRFSLLCGASNPFYCDDASDSFFIDGSGGLLAFGDQGNVQPLSANDFATGTVTAFALHDPVVSAPEPSFWLLLVAGLGYCGLGCCAMRRSNRALKSSKFRISPTSSSGPGGRLASLTIRKPRKRRTSRDPVRWIRPGNGSRWTRD